MDPPLSDLRITILSLSFKDFNASNSFSVKLFCSYLFIYSSILLEFSSHYIPMYRTYQKKDHSGCLGKRLIWVLNLYVLYYDLPHYHTHPIQLIHALPLV
ncbi:hypothetical protein XELAEV_18005979mg [Xenopus laevis]|uniref:Uncharacterized protein n=1 Tax=Xenopus laevis TaxID=8355 RepID=A0A974I3Y2_XENLA|nr:hypothetical protein XELAEV_18005979mg [Xenopus laevis]